MWERTWFRGVLWAGTLLALVLVVTFLQNGRGPWATAGFAILLVVLGAVVGPELTAFAEWLQSRVLGGRSSGLGRLKSPRQITSRLSPVISGLPAAYEPSAAHLREILERQCNNRDSDRLTLIVGDMAFAKYIIKVAFTEFDTFQCLVPNGSGGVVRWLKEDSVELPGKLDDRKPTVVLLGDFAAYHELGVEPADFDRWRGSKFTGLGWLKWSADRSGWLDRFFRVAYVIDSSRVTQKGSDDD